MFALVVKRFCFPLQEAIKRKPTYRYLKELEQSQWLSEKEIEKLQCERLKALLDYAGREVPYFGRLFDQNGICPGQIDSGASLSRLPYLDKETLRAHANELRPKITAPGTQRISTSGSTGSPVSVYVDRNRSAFTDAVRMRSHRWFDVDTGVREIALWGSPIELGRQDWRRNLRDWLVNSKFLAAFNMSEERMADYGRLIQRFRPAKMYGYASAFYLLAEYLKTRNWQPPSDLKVIFVTAEPLYDFQRSIIEQVFRCPVASEYGARDAGLMANECSKGSLHIPAEGMIVEIDAPDSTGFGEIVVTNLFSQAMPIIRYRTGDMGRLISEPCPCGRGLPRLESVEGRRTDFLITPSGRVLHALAIIYPLRETVSVKQFQVIQETVDKVCIRVVPWSGFSPEDRGNLLNKCWSVLGPGVTVDIECVTEILTPVSGKHRYVVSKIAQEFVNALSVVKPGPVAS